MLTFILFLELFIPRALPQVGKNLSQFTNYNIICSQGGLGLKEEITGITTLKAHIRLPCS